MFEVKLMNKISPVIYDYLPRSQFHVSSHIADDECDAMIVRSAPLHDTVLSDRLLCIARAGAGTNNIPVPACSEKGIVVFNTPGANANAVKELVLCCLIGAARNVFEAFDWVKSLKDSPGEIAELIEKGKGQFVGHEIMDKTLGVIGLGEIGIRVANVAAAVGMNVIGFDPYLSVDHAWHISRGTQRAVKLDELLKESDFISIHIPQTKDTMNYLSTPEFSKMKRGVIIVNMARGGLVKEVSLFDAIANGIVKKYITDFPSARMIGREGIVAIPHLGASTPESEDNCAIMAVNEIIDYIENGNITNSVNLPNMTMAITGSAKICVIHKNVEGVINNITAPISAAGMNIENMQSKSKKDYAYTCLDVAGNPAGIEEKLKAVANVVGVRVVK